MDRVIVLAVMALAFPYAATHAVVGAGDPIPEAVLDAMDSGRFWKASVALREHLGDLTEASMEERIVLATAESSWNNWPGALEALTVGNPTPGDGEADYWYLLGGAYQNQGNQLEAANAYQRYLDVVPGSRSEALVAGSRVIRNRARTDEWPSLAGPLDDLRARSPVVADWTALSLAREYRDAGRPTEVVGALGAIIDPSVRDEGWDLEVLAWAAARDTAAALEALERAADADAGGNHATAIAGLGWRFRLALGDDSGAASDMVAVLEATSRGSRAVRAIQALLELPSSATSSGGPKASTYLRGAAALAPAGHPRDAIRAWSAAADLGASLTESQRLTRAGALKSAGRTSDALDEYRALSTSETSSIGAPALRAWSRIRVQQGRRGDARLLADRLVERYPSSPEALDVIFFRGDDYHDAGRLDLAREHYAQVVSMSSSANRAGLARMRWAQIHVSREEYAAAADVYEGYLEEFPAGRRWEEASFWGAWARTEAGDEAGTQRLIQRLADGNSVSYYAVVARDLGGSGLTWNFPEGSPLPDPAWLQRDLTTLGVLTEAGLAEGAKAHIKAMKDASWESDDILMKLAVELNESGYSMDGINLGFELRRRGRPWDRGLLEVVFPFPYREVVLAFAEERNLDPFLIAGLIRQESAFVPDIISRAGAVGLMQVMPATGTALALAIGPSSFREASLKIPEVNVHLGTRFLDEMLSRFNQDLPLVLSAYNAGPTRANRWKKFPEAKDPWRFTERIPFAETRAYVKNVTRNRSLYAWLYAAEMGLAESDQDGS